MTRRYLLVGQIVVQVDLRVEAQEVRHQAEADAGVPRRAFVDRVLLSRRRMLDLSSERVGLELLVSDEALEDVHGSAVFVASAWIVVLELKLGSGRTYEDFAAERLAETVQSDDRRVAD
jgi:hypothetical protein